MSLIENGERPRALFQVGVGCFHFATERNPELTVGKFRDILIQGLNGISNVSNVDVQISNSYGTHPFGDAVLVGGSEGPDDRIPSVGSVISIETGPGLYPYLVDARVSFETFIPRRIHASVYEGGLHLDAERFLVQIFYEHSMPVAFVSCLDGTNNDPCDAVVVVRNFVTSQLESAGASVRLESLGPSPFHARFFIYEQQADDDALSVERTAGYAVVGVPLPIGPTTTVKNMHRSLFEELGRELSFYYAVVQARSRGLHRWSTMEIALHKVRAAFRRSSRLPDVLATFGMSRHYHDAVLAKFDLELEKIELDDAIQKYDRDTAQLKTVNSLRDFIADEAADYPTRDLAVVEALLRSVDSRRQEISRNWASIFSGIIGALIGFALAHIATAPATPTSTTTVAPVTAAPAPAPALPAPSHPSTATAPPKP